MTRVSVMQRKRTTTQRDIDSGRPASEQVLLVRSEDRGDLAGRPVQTRLTTPLGRQVTVLEHGTGAPVVLLHSGVGTAGEWRQVFGYWPAGHRLLAIDTYRDGNGPGVAGHRTIGDYADQVHAVAEYVGAPVHLVGFSWGGATALHVAARTPHLARSLAMVEPEAYGVLRTEDSVAYARICGLRDRWRARVEAGQWYEAFEEFIDFYNGPGAFAGWPRERREAFLATQQARGDLWDVLFDGTTVEDLSAVTAPTHVIEGSRSSTVDHAICRVVRRHVPHAHHTVIEGAGHMMPLTHPEELTRSLLARIEP